MVFGPIVPLKSLYIMRLAHCLYQKLPTYFSNEAKIVKSSSQPAGLLQSNPDNYTIQLMSSRNETQIVNYIQENKLGGKAEYYRYRHNNEIWYGLVYGSFATRTTAESRAQVLKQSLGLSGPWVRQISSIQKLAN
jgi:septal ring-binding cell division protein DamX